MVVLNPGDPGLLLAKRDYARRKIISRVFAERECGTRYIYNMAESEGSDNDTDLVTFSLKSSGECLALKITDAIVNFKLDSGADCNVISQSLFDRLSVAHKPARYCKAKLKVYDGRRITPRDKVSLVCKYKGKFIVLDFILVEQDLPFVLELKSYLELDLIKRI